MKTEKREKRKEEGKGKFFSFLTLKAAPSGLGRFPLSLSSDFMGASCTII